MLSTFLRSHLNLSSLSLVYIYIDESLAVNSFSIANMRTTESTTHVTFSLNNSTVFRLNVTFGLNTALLFRLNAILFIMNNA